MYIWSKEIKEINWNVVHFIDWSTKSYNNKQLSYIVTEDEKDLSTFTELVVENITNECMNWLVWKDLSDKNEVAKTILNIFEEHDISKWDVDRVLQEIKQKLDEIVKTIASSYNETLQKAIWKAFWTFEENKHSVYFTQNIRVSDIKKYI